MRPIVLLGLVACSTSSSPVPDIVGPFQGNVSRFAIDGFTLPSTQASARELGDDLAGSKDVDNQVGSALASLTDAGDITTHAKDMIASGAIASFIELQAPDLMTADKAGAWYRGADNADAVVMGGKIEQGTFTSNRTRTTSVPGRAEIHLPVFADADPSIVPVDKMELELTPDGHGGYDALVRGAVHEDDVFAILCAGLPQMIYSDPNDHYLLAQIIDNRAGHVTCDKIRSNTLFLSLLAPDVTIDGEQWVSIGFGAHLIPCASGECARSTPADACHDRVQDGNETGVDCGGTCGPCPVAQPTCTDGLRDGLETDIDCGWNCSGCSLGKQCFGDADCASSHCNRIGDALGACVSG